MALEESHKFGYLRGEIPKPEPGDPQKCIWKGEDSLLRPVLVNSMETQIGRPLLYAATAKDIWDAMQKLYSKRKNASRLYTQRKQVHDCKQGTMDVTSYVNKLSPLWKEMDLCQEIVWNCAQDGAQYLKIEEVDRVYDFLAGLNSKFNIVQS
ncbi:uncharacterized protein LOC120076218 [Benincasa hispida]|uniref:uncharacterized protein LOC120076218 n=1 Tax=Benincasa hispida TaxID=102211 RepID=UPI001902AB75|nr:uncharacterized protein LOC120076218 [Benincasa hispida]